MNASAISARPAWEEGGEEEGGRGREGGGRGRGETAG